jgi:hypothetical protein
VKFKKTPDINQAKKQYIFEKSSSRGIFMA